ncbi:MAG: hypothetical protein WBP18_19615 [Paracoccaceae bacterium]|jgi:hypothetical protein
MAVAPKPLNSPAISYHADERALLRSLPLRSLSALEQMYAYFGSDRA